MTFYEKMRIVCLAVPEGRVATYGQIAMLCGKPGNARQVGYGLKMNLAGADVPAFRIVNGRGMLSGAHQFVIPGLQQKLLEEEGVLSERKGDSWFVDLARFGWKTTPEDAERFRKQFE